MSKLVPTLSLLPVARYARSYVPIDSRLMGALIAVYNKDKPDKPIVRPAKGEALAAMVPEPSLATLKRRRSLLRRAQERMGPTAKKRGAACGLGLCKWPQGAELTSIRTDGVGVSLCFTVTGRKPARTFDSSADVQQVLQGRTRVAYAGVDPGSVNPVTVQAAYLPDSLDLNASPDSFWWRSRTDCSAGCTHEGCICGCSSSSERTPVRTEGSVLSAGTYYKRGLIRQQQRWQKKRRSKHPSYVAACSGLSETGTWKTPDTQSFRAMCSRLNGLAADFHSYDVESVDAAKRRMLLFRRKRSLLDQTAQRAVDMALKTAEKAGEHADALVMGYGNASTKTPRGCAPVPHKELRTAFRRALDRVKAKAAQGSRIVQRGPRVVLLLSIDEFRTSMLCHVCHEKMVERKIKLPGSGRECPDRNFRFCSHCGSATEGARKRSRDGNAADNMLYKAWLLAKGLEMPTAFRRPSQATQQ
jgi:hypothetical protein